MSNAAVPPGAPRVPSHAERCRTLVARARHGTLCTLAREPMGYPFGSLVALACDDAGCLLLLLSNIAEHTQNLSLASEASILVVDRMGATGGAWSGRASTKRGGAGERERDALSLARATLIGACTRIGAEGLARDARETFLAVHPEAASYAQSKDFAMYRLEPTSVRHVGGFGRVAWVTTVDYMDAEADPLFEVEAEMIAHMNDDHPDAVLAYARAFGGITTASRALMTTIDRYGFELLAVTEDGEKLARIPFADDVTSTESARRAFVALVRDARTALAHPG